MRDRWREFEPFNGWFTGGEFSNEVLHAAISLHPVGRSENSVG